VSDTRIVLVKPGDVLMLGNVTLPKGEDAVLAFSQALRTLRETLGLAGEILVFEDDIDLAVKPSGTAETVEYFRSRQSQDGE
jgi:hypothetical protein